MGHRLHRILTTPVDGFVRLCTAAVTHWFLWSGAVVIGGIAFGLRAQYVLQAPTTVIQWFGHQNDPQLFFISALVITHLGWKHLLWPSFDFPLVGPSWGPYCPVGLALVLGGVFMKLWGFYPGLLYWVWGLVVGGSLLCLVPYLWQRCWGYPGIGGLVAGMLLATSRGLREIIPRMLTDAQAYLCLGGALVFLARLATRERWRDVWCLSGFLVALGATRLLMLPICMVMLGVLGGIWGLTATSWTHGRQRLRRWATVWGLMVLGLAAIEVTLLFGYAKGNSFFLSLVPKAGSANLLSQDQLKNILHLLPIFITDLGREHPAWVWVLPAAAVVGFWCLRDAHRTPHWQPFLLLSVPIVVYSLEAVSRWAYETRYTYPAIILEAVLLAFIIDLVWLQLREGIRRFCAPGWREVAWGSLGLVAVVSVAGMALRPGQHIAAQWTQLRQAAAQQAAYLAWVKPQLPANAVILTGDTVDPWAVARALDRPTIFPINIASSYRGQALLVNPRELARHPFRVIHYTPDSFTIVPSVSLTPHSFLTKEELEKAGSGHFATVLFDDYLHRGATLCVLGAPADPFLADRLREECDDGRYQYFTPGRYRLLARGQAPAGASWTWYQLTAWTTPQNAAPAAGSR